MKKMTRIFLPLCIVLVMPQLVFAGDFDGSAPLLCALVETFECDGVQNCQSGTPEDVNIPQFLRIDFKNNMISGKQVGGEKRTTQISNTLKHDGRLILQGTQEGMGWSIVIMESTGKMTLTASGEEVGFAVFGACTQD